MADAIYRFLTAVGYPHPLHPVLTHVTIGSVIAALVFGLVGWIARRRVLMTTAYHVLILGFISAFLTISVGVIDWLHFYGGQWITAIIVKMIASGVLLLLMLATLIVQREVGRESKILLVFYILMFLNVMVLGFFGGNLVYGGG